MSTRWSNLSFFQRINTVLMIESGSSKKVSYLSGKIVYFISKLCLLFSSLHLIQNEITLLINKTAEKL